MHLIEARRIKLQLIAPALSILHDVSRILGPFTHQLDSNGEQPTTKKLVYSERFVYRSF